MPQTLDNWPTIVVAVLAAVAAFLVPFNSFIKTMLDYRLEAKKAEALKPEVARDIVSSGGALFDSMALSDLTGAVKALTAAVIAGTASEEAHHTNQMASAISKLTEAVDRWEKDQGKHPQGRR